MKYGWRSGLIIVLLLISACGPPARVRGPAVSPERIPVIRVGIFTGQDAVRVTGTGRFQVEDLTGGERLGDSGRGQVWRFASKGAWIDVVSPDGKSAGLFSGPIRLTPADRGGRVWVSGREYRGVVDVRSSSGKLTVVNEVDVENYLRGVVPEEIGRLPESRIEAVKAQTIAARTYALANIGRRAASGFDVLATVDDQVYRGFVAEAKLIDRAIAETHGVVATYKGEMIAPFYSSTCGGRTDNIQDGWQRPPVPYLKSVKDSGRGVIFCKDSPAYRWTVQWDRDTLEKILTTSLPAMGYKLDGAVELLDLRIRKRSGSGRVSILEIKTRKGEIRVEGDRIRRVLRRPEQGTPTLRSTLFSLKIDHDRQGRPRSIIANGGGYGHGIGLCQFGAIGMAGRGYRYDAILNHYYHGIKLRRAY